MPKGDQLIAAIEAIHAAGLEAELWPQALGAITQLCGAGGATFEVFHKPTQRHTDFYSVGMPTTVDRDYVEHWGPISPRVRSGLRQKAGELGWDYQFIDDAAMDRDAFYADFLEPSTAFRYFISAMLSNTPEEIAVVAVQRTRRQGHVGATEIALMRTLGPHLQQAHDVARRLKSAEARRSLEDTLDWLSDGVALVRADGTVCHVNAALQAIARRGDGVRVRGGALEFDNADASMLLANAIGAATTLAGRIRQPAAPRDFHISRPGPSHYLVSVRPLGRTHHQAEAVAIVFIRDPMERYGATAPLLREMFGFTDAESNLAQAVHAGISLADYARANALTLNTVYTHLRRIKDKTGSQRMAELIRRLNDLQVPLRLE